MTQKFSWLKFKSSFYSTDGRIVDTGNGGVSHTEGQGYGMLLAQAADDRDAFQRMWSWTQAHLARKGDALFSWRYDPNSTPQVADPNNAADGDILIAWALLCAGRRWKDKAYLEASETIRASILRLLVKLCGGRQVLLPGASGFESGDYVELNPSYYVWPALDAFAAEDGEALWGGLIKDGLAILKSAQFGPNRLTPDWIVFTAAGAVQLPQGRQPRFGFDAIRVPLYLVWSKRGPLAEPFAKYWNELMSQDVTVIPAWIDVSTGAAAGYPLSAGGLEVARYVTGRPSGGWERLNLDYYSSALAHLTALARSEPSDLFSAIRTWTAT